MAKAIRKEPLAHKLAKLVDDQSDLLKVQNNQSERLFKIIKAMEITIRDQHELIVELSKSMDAANQRTADIIEKVPKHHSN